MNKIKNTKGITLVALVITIIILLILAGITIGQLTKNGLFDRAKQAKQNSVDAQELENSILLDYERQIDELGESKKEVQETDIYVKLYTDGTLAFSSIKDKKVDGKDLDNSYNDENIRGKSYTNLTDNAPLWYSDRASITSVVVLDEIVPISTARWFQECDNLKLVDLKKLNTSKVTDMQRMFCTCNALASISIDVNKFDTSNVTDMNRMFSDCENLENIDVSKFNTSNVTNMRFMFSYCEKLTNIDVSKFNTSSVTDMGSMFSHCKKLTNIDVSKFNTSSVTDMIGMFSGCINLTSLDLSNFDTSNITDMSRMFYNCSNLTNIYVSEKWVTTNVTTNTDMFTGCGTSQVTIK